MCDRREYGDDWPLYDQGEHRDESYCVSERDMEGNEEIKRRQAGGAPNTEEKIVYYLSMVLVARDNCTEMQ